MLLEVENITCDKCPPAIEKAIHAMNGEADVTVDTAESRVRIEGGITQQQAIDALSAAGYPASAAAPHSGAGSECCGGCS